MEVQVVNHSNNPLPAYANPGDAGCDVRAELFTLNHEFLFGSVFDKDNSRLIIHPGGRALIPSEIYTAIPEGYEIQVRPRSGLALKHGVTIINTPGTIDSEFRSSIGVILINHGLEDFIVNQGDRIAQFVLNKVEQIDWIECKTLDKTDRGLTGFGDSGIK